MKRSEKRRGLVLDVGGVLVRSLFEMRRPLERLLGLETGQIAFSGPFGDPPDELWQRMQAHELSEREYWNVCAAELGRLLGREWTIQDVCSQFNRLSQTETLRPAAVALVHDAKQAGCRLGVLSNELELFHGPEWVESIDIFGLMDSIVDATHTKILKPDPRAYEAVVRALNLEPHEIVFIDDQPRNVAGARKFGLHAVQLDVRTPDAAFGAAREALGL